MNISLFDLPLCITVTLAGELFMDFKLLKELQKNSSKVLGNFLIQMQINKLCVAKAFRFAGTVHFSVIQ